MATRVERGPVLRRKTQERADAAFPPRTGEPGSATPEHLDLRYLQRLIDATLPAAEEEVAASHLLRCSRCRGGLRARLQNAEVASDSPAWRLLQRAEQWAGMAAAGLAATDDARRELHRLGLRPVSLVDGVLVEETEDGEWVPLPDGSGSA